MRFSLRMLLLLVVIGGTLLGLGLRHFLAPVAPKPKLYALLGPVTTGGPPAILPPPSDAEVLRVIGATPVSATVSSKRLLSEHTGPSMVRPLVGSTRLHTATYLYVLNRRGKQEVVLVDHNHMYCEGE